MVLVGDVMSKNLVYVTPEDSLTKARSIIRDQGFRVLPVIEDGKLVGMISRSDVLRVTSSKTNISVGGLMDRNIYTVSPQEELKEAVKKLVASGKKQLLVVDKKPVGIITALNILSELVSQGVLPVMQDISGVMSREVVFCSPDDDLSSVWGRITETGFSGMPVIEKEKVVGMVTRMDLLKQGRARLSRESGRAKNVSVRKVMSKPAVTSVSSDSTASVAEKMASNRILRIPIVDSYEKLVGLADVEDVLRAYAGV